jgi:hypothetical protein
MNRDDRVQAGTTPAPEEYLLVVELLEVPLDRCAPDAQWAGLEGPLPQLEPLAPELDPRAATTASDELDEEAPCWPLLLACEFVVPAVALCEPLLPAAAGPPVVVLDEVPLRVEVVPVDAATSAGADPVVGLLLAVAPDPAFTLAGSGEVPPVGIGVGVTVSVAGGLWGTVVVACVVAVVGAGLGAGAAAGAGGVGATELELGAVATAEVCARSAMTAAGETGLVAW